MRHNSSWSPLFSAKLLEDVAADGLLLLQSEIGLTVSLS